MLKFFIEAQAYSDCKAPVLGVVKMPSAALLGLAWSPAFEEGTGLENEMPGARVADVASDGDCCWSEDSRGCARL